MTISWSARHFEQGDDEITEYKIKLVNPSVETLQKMTGGIEQLRTSEHQPRRTSYGDGSIAMSDCTHYDWDDGTYTGALLLQLTGVDTVAYKTRCGQLLDLTRTATIKENNDG